MIVAATTQGLLVAKNVDQRNSADRLELFFDRFGDPLDWVSSVGVISRVVVGEDTVLFTIGITIDVTDEYLDMDGSSAGIIDAKDISALNSATLVQWKFGR